MSVRYDFLMAVQAAFLLRRTTSKEAARALDLAFDIPEHALPRKKIASEALAYVQWRVEGGNEPEWHKESHEKRVRVSLDASAKGSAWWKHAEYVGIDSVPNTCRGLFSGKKSVVISRDDADILQDWARELPGYEDVMPFCFEDVGDGSSPAP